MILKRSWLSVWDHATITNQHIYIVCKIPARNNICSCMRPVGLSGTPPLCELVTLGSTPVRAIFCPHWLSEFFIVGSVMYVLYRYILRAASNSARVMNAKSVMESQFAWLSRSWVQFPEWPITWHWAFGRFRVPLFFHFFFLPVIIFF